MQQIRLYFPLLTSRQLITGVNTAYRQEINKLRHFGSKYVQPYLPKLKFRKYPYKITFTFYSSSDTDIISVLTTISYIIHLFENYATLQSSDYRIAPQIEIKTEIQKTDLFAKEGCLITLEPLKTTA